MKIQVSEISDDGLEIDDIEDLETITSGVVKTARLKLKSDKLKDEVFLKGNISTVLNLQCSRCLRDFEEGLTIDLNLALSPAEKLSTPEMHDLEDGAMETGYYVNKEIDLAEVANEQILLSVPMKPLCNKDCKGLCPICGTDLNENRCGCTIKHTDPRMQALERLLNKGKE